MEYTTWKRSGDSTRFWASKRRRKIQLDAHTGVADYVGNIVNEEVSQLYKDKDQPQTIVDTAVNENENILLQWTETSQEASKKQESTFAFNGNEDYTDSTVENEEAEAESQDTAIFNPYKDLSRFETAQDRNIYKLFDIYQAEATKLSNVGFIKIETYLYEILSLTNTLMFASNQHSELLLQVFSADTLDLLYHSLFNDMTNNKKKTRTINDKFEEIKMIRVIEAVEDSKMTKSGAE